MRHRAYETGLCVAFSISVNCLFRYLALRYGLPVRLDSFGTVLAAYLLGPCTGAIVGAATGMLQSLHNSQALFYILPQGMIGLLAGWYSRKGCFRTFFDTVSACTAITGVTTVLYTVCNCVLDGGLSGNVWGDGIFTMLREYGVHWGPAALLGEFFLDFLDKFLIMIALYFLLRLGRYGRKKCRGKAIGKVLKRGLVLLLTLSTVAMILTVPVSAQEETPDYSRYIRTTYSSAEGLLSGEANDIASTDDGIIWIGTYAGLYRYSGGDFQYMSGFDRVKNVNCLFVDVEGRLWIGTNDDGLSICIGNEIVTTFDEDRGFPSNSVRSVVQSSDGNFYVGTSGSLAVLTLAGGSKILKTYGEISYAYDLTADEKGHVAALTAAGELFLLNSRGVLQSLVLRPETGSYTCCAFGADGRLYLGTDKGQVYVYRLIGDRLAGGQRLEIQGLNALNSIRQLENGCLVLCADNAVGWLDRTLTFHSINTGSFGSRIEHMTEDYQGDLWFTSSRLGVMKLCPSAFVEVYPETGLEGKVVNAITQWGDELYFGTDAGLDILDRAKATVVENGLSDFLKGSRVRCLLVDSKDRLWICAYGQGVICAESAEDYRLISEGIPGKKPRSILELSAGGFAVATEQGVTFLQEDGSTKTVGRLEGMNNPLVLCLLEQQDGTILAGTDGGGIALLQNGRVKANLGRSDGLSSGVILRLVPDGDTGNVFVVASNGLCYYEPGTGIRLLKSFPYSNNYDLLDIGDGKLYVTGSAGIYIVDKQELLEDQVVSSENLNYLSGLRGSFTANAWNYLDESGNWFIAGGSGVTKFDFNQYLTQERQSYRMLLDKVTIDGAEHLLGDEAVITIPSSAVSVVLSPEIINYSAREPYVCYYLEGYDEEEKTVLLQRNLGDIVYNNLDSGEYRFHLSILDSPKGKPIEELIYTVRKEAESYEHLWFKTLFFTELILIVTWLTWFFTRKWSQRALELQRRETSLARDQVRMGNETILAIAKTVDAKDENTSQHSFRVAEYSCMIAKRMGYSAEDLENLRRAALLHDIGKIGIPDNVLNKPGRLTDEEYAIMKSHVVKGGEILKDFTLIPHVQEGAMYHHERYDGKGYVSGLSGKDIPEIARIIGIADAFDAMTANRVYRKHLPFAVVLQELHKGRGTQFDPDILDVFLGIIDDGLISEETLYGKEEC